VVFIRQVVAADRCVSQAFVDGLAKAISGSLAKATVSQPDVILRSLGLVLSIL